MHPVIEKCAVRRERVFGGWLTSPSETIPQGYARVGYDYIGIDCQHGLLNETDAAIMLRRLAGWPLAAFVRVGANDAAAIGRVVDAGADGVIVPMVETAEQAAAVIAAIRYPPSGVRSFGPGRPDLGYALGPLEDRVLSLVMIETALGLENVEAICATPGLGGVYVGPADLGIGLGVAPVEVIGSPIVDEAITRIAQAADAAGIVPGVATDCGTVAARIGQGFRLMTLGADILSFMNGARQELETARNAGGH